MTNERGGGIIGLVDNSLQGCFLNSFLKVLLFKLIKRDFPDFFSERDLNCLIELLEEENIVNRCQK